MIKYYKNLNEFEGDLVKYKGKNFVNGDKIENVLFTENDFPCFLIEFKGTLRIFDRMSVSYFNNLEDDFKEFVKENKLIENFK